MNSRRPSHYKLLTFFVAAVAGIVVADFFVPAAGSWANILVAAAVAALIAIVMVWLRGKRRAPPP